MADSQKTFPLDELLLPFTKLPREYQSQMWHRGYRLTSAEIDVERLDMPGQVQTLYGQELDQAPDFPVLHAFIDELKKSGVYSIKDVRVQTVDTATPGQLTRQSISLAVH